MRTHIKALSCFLALVVSCFVTVNAQAPNPGQIGPAVNLDHYKVYRISADFQIPIGALINTHDQLGSYDVIVRDYFRHLNPVDKNHEGILDKNAHLSWYRVDAPQQPVRSVVAEDQFGMHEFRIQDLVGILVPTEKIEPGSSFPEKLSHYNVYRIVQSNPIYAPVWLVDQFIEEENVAQTPVFFAVPAGKVHNNAYFPILNDADHLIFYRLNPIPYNFNRPTKDQFGLKKMLTSFSELLGVPCLKHMVQ
ncbi:MAG: hypothetical protein QNK37_16220 [Acidobacteriota bacterium]|nr:hypothetical protein [Acidobacteriota bacterium]